MFFFFFFAVKIHTTVARECYVCGSGSTDPFTNNKSAKPMAMLSCDEFEQSDNLDKFIAKCPEGYVGCTTQTDGQYYLFYYYTIYT